MKTGLSFFWGWLRFPLRTGALLPSGQDLSQAIVRGIDPSIDGTIIELGSGTGSITKAILDRGIQMNRLLCIENNPDFCAFLAQKFPGIQVKQEDAFDIQGIVRRHNISKVAAVISGLPMLNYKTDSRLSLLNQALQIMPPGAPFLQYTYHRQPSIQVNDPAIKVERIAKAWLNIPPATVWKYTRKT